MDSAKTDIKWHYRTWVLVLLLFSPLAFVSLVLMLVGKRYPPVVRWLLVPVFGGCALFFTLFWLIGFGVIEPEEKEHVERLAVTERVEEEVVVEKATEKEPVMTEKQRKKIEKAHKKLAKEEVKKADDFCKKKDYQSACEHYAKAKELILASIKEKEKQRKEIEKINKKLAETEVKKADDFYFNKKDYQSACEHYAKAKELNPKALGEKHERLFSIIQEKLEKAEILYQQAQNLLEQAQAFLAQNQFTSASDSTKKAVRLLKKAEDFPESAKLLSEAEQLLISIKEAEKEEKEREKEEARKLKEKQKEEARKLKEKQEAEKRRRFIKWWPKAEREMADALTALNIKFGQKLFLRASITEQGETVEVTVSDTWYLLNESQKEGLLELCAEKYAKIHARGAVIQKAVEEDYPTTILKSEGGSRLARKSWFGTKVYQ